MNFNYQDPDNTTVTLGLRNSCGYRVWGAKGLEQMGNNQYVTVNLWPGEGRFVEIYYDKDEVTAFLMILITVRMMDNPRQLDAIVTA